MQDWQGSTRVVTNAHGFVKSRNDYTAFGEDINSGTGLRTENQGFGSSENLRQKYGLTERDDATGLDHTWFRKNENQAGRWTSPDPYNGSQNINDPQSFNKYSYVQNDPANFVDPSGLLEEGDRCRVFDEDGHGYDGIFQNGQCVVGFSNTFEVNSHWSDPTVLTGPAAILYMWNPTANTTYVNVLDSVGGGGQNISTSTKVIGNDGDKWKKRAECFDDFTDTVIDITVENAFAHLGIGIGFLIGTLATGGAGAVVAALVAAGASAIAVSIAAYKIWAADREYRKCLRRIG